MIRLLLMIVAAANAADIERTFRVAPAEIRSLRFPVKNRPATLELDFKVQKGGAPVRLVVIPEADENRFRAGRDVTLISSTEYQRDGRLRAYIKTPGEYVVVVDNRAELKHAAMVELRGALDYDLTPRPSRELSRERRWAVVALSLAFFFGTAWFAGRRLWSATVGRRSVE